MPPVPPEGFDDEGRPIERRPRPPRAYVGIYFECCGVYGRVYRRPDEPGYVGRCPGCLRTVCLRVGPDGTNARQFRAY